MAQPRMMDRDVEPGRLEHQRSSLSRGLQDLLHAGDNRGCYGSGWWRAAFDYSKRTQRMAWSKVTSSARSALFEKGHACLKSRGQERGATWSQTMEPRRVIGNKRYEVMMVVNR